ncbi:reverse transcriptase family protein [Aurantimicrobium minutum]|uniref:reverse transcriptase family protein n=1 Tax=Aurantimicrobium minutum TaxID=708131 RepID=UPI0024762B28|nr:reverse transcriptase family protein [Aurantimicrobium minutum]MDH6536920.1 RNA-directed DNA polymerase [Aurantimicrobium minutum]
MGHQYSRKHLSQPELSFSSVEELAAVVGSNENRLLQLGRHEVDLYDDVLLKNPRTGKIRHLSIPQPELMQIQKKLLKAMKVNWYGSRSGSIPQAYIARRSIRSAAHEHPWAKTGFKVDIKDFFPSINQMMLMDRWGHIELEHQTIDFRKLRLIVTGLATRPRVEEDPRFGFDTYLPQGAPTSGFFANLAARGLDHSLWRIARNEDFRVTRYSDDILFTSDNVRTRVELEQALERVQGAVVQHGFQVNEKKSRILTAGSRLEVLGLMLGGKEPRLSRAKRRRIDSEMRAISKFGLAAHSDHIGEDMEVIFRRLNGYFSFAQPYEKSWAMNHKAELKRCNEALTPKELEIIEFIDFENYDFEEFDQI